MSNLLLSGWSLCVNFKLRKLMTRTNSNRKIVYKVSLETLNNFFFKVRQWKCDISVQWKTKVHSKNHICKCKHLIIYKYKLYNTHKYKCIIECQTLKIQLYKPNKLHTYHPTPSPGIKGIKMHFLTVVIHV